MSDHSGGNSNRSGEAGVTIGAFQNLIRNMYLEKDIARGVPATFMWLMEEVGELASALRETSPDEVQRISEVELENRRANLKEEFADVMKNPGHKSVIWIDGRIAGRQNSGRRRTTE